MMTLKLLKTTVQPLLVLVCGALFSAALFAQNVSQPKVISVPDQVRTPSRPIPMPAPPLPRATGNASASALAVGGALRTYQFGGREMASKFSLPGTWTVVDNQLSLAGAFTRLVPEGQTSTAFSQRVTVQELPTWVDTTRLGKEYLNDIVDECVAGNMTLLEKGSVSKMPADVVLLECTDTLTQSVKLAYSVVVQGQKSNVVFSRLVRAPLNSPRAQEIARSELATFKQMIANLYVCMPNAMDLCR